jgi:hypothetical protein
MKEMLKSYGGTALVVLATIALVAYFAPESAKKWLRI